MNDPYKPFFVHFQIHFPVTALAHAVMALHTGFTFCQSVGFSAHFCAPLPSADKTKKKESKTQGP